MSISSGYVDSGYMTFIADEDLNANRLVKLSGDRTVALAGIGDQVIGFTSRSVLDTLPVPIALLNKPGTVIAVADGTISQNAPVYAGASGKVSATASGVAIGIALAAASADGDEIDVLLTERDAFDDLANAFTLFNDFFSYTSTEDFTSILTDSGTAVDSDAAGGVLVINPSDGSVADNDEAYVKSTQEVFLFAANKPLAFEARVKWTEANTNTLNVIVGLMSAAGANALVDDGAGPATSFSGAVFYKVDGGSTWKALVSNGSTQTEVTLTNIPAAPGAGNYQRLSIIFVPTSSTAATILFYIDKVLVGSASYTHTSATEMNTIVGAKNGAITAVETLYVDYVRCSQVR